MDISSAEPGANAAGENKPAEAEKAAEASLENSEKKNLSAESNDPVSAREDVDKVLAYGPAQREVEAPEIKAHPPESRDAPEIRADNGTEKLKEPESAAKKPAVPGSALIPFIAKNKEDVADTASAPVPPPRFESLRSRSMQAALVAACVGIAWAFAGSLFTGHSIKEVPVQAAALPDSGDAHRQTASAVSESAETHRLAEEVRVLKKEIDGLRSSMAQNPGTEELRTLKKNVDALKNGLEGTKSELGSSLAQLSAKLEHAQHDPAKLREISDRLDHMEHATPLTTAAIAPTPAPETPAKVASVPLPPAKAQPSVQPQTVANAKPTPNTTPAPNTTAAPTSEKPQLLTNWVVRDVYDGIALVEGPHGSIEVIEGENIPGAGTVKSIERRGSGWIVVTSRGLVDSARN